MIEFTCGTPYQTVLLGNLALDVRAIGWRTKRQAFLYGHPQLRLWMCAGLVTAFAGS